MNGQLENYIENIPVERGERFNILHSLVMRLYPEADVDMDYKMPTYRVGEGWVAIANQKNYISLYTCGEQHIESFKEKHSGIKTGKGCINFRDSDDLPLKDIEQVIKHAIEFPKAGSNH